MCSTAFVETTSGPPKWIKALLTRLVDEAPSGSGWLHEIKYDGYRMNARIDGRDASSCSRTGLDWSRHYERTIKALHALPGEPGVRQGHRDPHVHDGLHRPWPSRRVRRPEALASQAVVKLL
jgi:hypothetical protein